MQNICSWLHALPFSLVHPVICIQSQSGTFTERDITYQTDQDHVASHCAAVESFGADVLYFLAACFIRSSAYSKAQSVTLSQRDIMYQIDQDHVTSHCAAIESSGADMLCLLAAIVFMDEPTTGEKHGLCSCFISATS